MDFSSIVYMNWFAYFDERHQLSSVVGVDINESPSQMYIIVILAFITNSNNKSVEKQKTFASALDKIKRNRKLTGFATAFAVTSTLHAETSQFSPIPKIITVKPFSGDRSDFPLYPLASSGKRESEPVSLNSAKMRGVHPEREVVQSDLMLCHHLGHLARTRRDGTIESFGFLLRFHEIVCWVSGYVVLEFVGNFRLLIMT